MDDFITFIDESDEYHTFRRTMIDHIHWGGILTGGDICLTNLFDADGTEVISIDHRVEQNRRSLLQLAGDIAKIATFDLSSGDSGDSGDSDDSDDSDEFQDPYTETINQLSKDECLAAILGVLKVLDFENDYDMTIEDDYGFKDFYDTCLKHSLDDYIESVKDQAKEMARLFAINKEDRSFFLNTLHNRLQNRWFFTEEAE